MEDPGVIFEEEEPSEVKQKPLPRKPLPESAKPSLDLTCQVSAVPDSLSTSNVPREVSRKALPTESQTSTQPQSQPLAQAKDQFQRKPLGPRPLLPDAGVNKQPFSEMENKSLGSRAEVLRAPFSEDSNRGVAQHIPNMARLYDSVNCPPESARTFSITVIRRDPSSGAQWNIGEVIGEQELTPVKPSHSKKPYFDISVHLSTPGYTQFRVPQTKFNLPSGNPPSMPETLHEELPGFHRKIRMEGSNFWDRPKERMRSQSDVSGIIDPLRRRSDNFGLTEPNSNNNNDTGTKGYTFTSPWGGRCKFSTSNSGRTLRCKHTLPGPISAESGSTNQATAPLSELRFNLPSLIFHNHSHGSPNKSKDPISDSSRFQMPKFGHIRHKLSPDKILRPSLPPRPEPTSFAALYPSDDESRPPLPPRPLSTSYGTESSDDDADDARLDLSIGQEKAGGGNRGKRAKLGKLIVLDEGFKMLDLVVAANMGIWWSVWESNS
jgi:hypothetical protein